MLKETKQLGSQTNVPNILKLLTFLCVWCMASITDLVKDTDLTQAEASNDMNTYYTPSK